MSAAITLHCDREWQYGGCPARLYTDAATIAEARTAGDRHGWRTGADGRDYCPTCSGVPAPRRTTVVHLQPKDRP